MTFEERIVELGLTLPQVAKPAGAYVPACRAGSLVFTAGQIPVVDGTLLAIGKVGADLTAERAQELAKVCVLNALAAVRDELGSLDQVRRVVRVGVFVASDPDFTGQAMVANGASDVLVEVFGDAGLHARTAVGVPVLPLNSPVEVELVVEVA